MARDFNGDGLDDDTGDPMPRNSGSSSGTNSAALGKLLGVPVPAGSVTPNGKPAASSAPDTLWWDKPMTAVRVDTSSLQGVSNASNPQSATWGNPIAKNRVTSFFQLPKDVRDDLNKIAKIYHPLATGKSFYETMVSDSAKLYESGTNISPLRLAYNWASSSGGIGAGGSQGGKYTGPVTRTDYSITDSTSAAVLLNNMAGDLLGRNLTDAEIAKYTKDLNAAERKNPSVTTSTPTGHNSVVTSTTAPTKEVLARQILKSTDDAVDHTLDTKVVDMFLNDIKQGQATIHG